MDFHQTPRAMARVLVQYIPCNRKIQSEIVSHFGSNIDLSSIQQLRQSYERKLQHDTKHDASVVWMDERHTNDMDEANKCFVHALTNARIL